MTAPASPSPIGLDGTARVATVASRFETTRSAMAFGFIQAAAVLAWLAQMAMDSGADNAASATIVLISSTITVQYLRLTGAFAVQPFSSLAVLGLCMTTQLGALVTQSGSWTPIADNLRTPVKTFALLGGYQMMALAGLWTSAHLPPATAFRRLFTRRLLVPMGIFETPPPAQVWFLGFVGFAAIMSGALLNGGGGVAGKLIDGCRFLAWSPFIIPVLARGNPHYCNLPRQMVAILSYTLAVVGLGMAVNARTVMFVGVMTVALLALMLTLCSKQRMHPAQLLKFLPVVPLLAIGLEYASDLAVAGVIARDQRGSVTPVEMIQRTVELLLDKPVLEAFKASIDTYSQLALYDEYYISNQVLARLIETKFHDNMFFLSSDLQPAELDTLKQHTLHILWAALPEPVLQLFDIPIDKASLGYSVGDLFDYLHYGSELGSFKIGSIFAHGQALFGHWFFLIYAAMCAVVFVVWDSFAQQQADGSMRYAPLAMLCVLGIFFNTISGDSIMVVVGFLVRGTVQTIVVYATVLAAAKVFMRTTGLAGHASARYHAP